jgi:TonB family protein
MKQLLLSLIIILSFQFLNAQDTSYLSANWKPCNKLEATYARIVKIGNSGYKTKDYYFPSWEIQMTGYFEDHELKYKTGDFFYYRKDGTLRLSEYFELDQLNDWQVLYTTEGNPFDSTFYARGEKENTRKVYHTNGYLWYTRNYKNGILQDSTITYYPDGKIKRVEIYEDNNIKKGFCFDSEGKKIKYTPLIEDCEFPDGKEALFVWLLNNTTYPNSMSKSNMVGSVTIDFFIYKDGTLGDFNIISSNHEAFSNEAIKVLKKMPAWTPTKIDGESIMTQLKLPLFFKTTEKDEEDIGYTIDGEPVYSRVPEMPEFDGGETKLKEFIGKNLNYPDEAIENNVETVQLVSFLVLMDGKITQVKVKKKSGWGIDEEAIRIIKSMPMWIPGKLNGAPVNVRMTVSIPFKLPK